MLEQSLLINLSSPGITENTTSQLRREYLAYVNLLHAQPAMLQQFLGEQAASLAEAIVEGSSHVRFTLPDRIVVTDQDLEAKIIPIPAGYRQQELGGILSRLRHTNLFTALSSRLSELENSENLAVSYSAILLRHVLVMHLIYNVLPVGKSVQYNSKKRDDIPSIPVYNETLLVSEYTAEAEAAVFKENRSTESGAELLVPYVDTARGFFMPQWVAFDEQHHLLVADLNEASAQIDAMKRYWLVLQTAVGLAPYMVADEEYQHKRYGILGQLVNQGRALANYEVEEIIRTIKQHVTAHELDRGLSLRLPYFNDQTLRLEIYRLDVIPAGRVMFVPAFVVLAVRAEGAKVAQDTRFNKSTRRHLLMILRNLEETFLR
jgi:hypothetical protein